MTRRQRYNPSPTFMGALVCLIMSGVLLMTVAHADHDNIEHVDTKLMPPMTYRQFTDFVDEVADEAVNTAIEQIAFLCETKRTFSINSQPENTTRVYSCSRIPTI